MILDDGFQHRHLARDADLVLIDATLPFGYGRLLPRGLLREPLSALKRATQFILTRVDLASESDVERSIATIRHWAPQTPIAQTRLAPVSLSNYSGQRRPLSDLQTSRWLGLAAIGNPENFRRQLQRLGCRLESFRAFADHHPFTPTELDSLAASAYRAGAKHLVCTGKDLVKIAADQIGQLSVWSLDVAIEFVSGQLPLEQAIANVSVEG